MQSDIKEDWNFHLNRFKPWVFLMPRCFLWAFRLNISEVLLINILPVVSNLLKALILTAQFVLGDDLFLVFGCTQVLKIDFKVTKVLF